MVGVVEGNSRPGALLSLGNTDLECHLVPERLFVSMSCHYILSVQPCPFRVLVAVEYMEGGKEGEIGSTARLDARCGEFLRSTVC